MQSDKLQSAPSARHMNNVNDEMVNSSIGSGMEQPLSQQNHHQYTSTAGNTGTKILGDTDLDSIQEMGGKTRENE